MLPNLLRSDRQRVRVLFRMHPHQLPGFIQYLGNFVFFSYGQADRLLNLLHMPPAIVEAWIDIVQRVHMELYIGGYFLMRSPRRAAAVLFTDRLKRFTIAALKDYGEGKRFSDHDFYAQVRALF